jgi:NAD(P)-dependent dehydrogenase (short-subunit alcohol dehydrogenase family)
LRNALSQAQAGIMSTGAVNNRDLAGTRIWITGASSGIGAELAAQLAQNGCHVIVSARRVEALSQLQQRYPGNIDVIACDVSSEHDMRAAATELARRYNSLDALVINAGVCEYIDVGAGDWPLDVQSMRRVFDVNVFGAVHAVNAALPLLRRARSENPDRRPLIAGVTSLSTYTAFPRAEAYGASKAALRYFLEALRTDIAHEGIDVTVISPGFVATPLTAQNDFPMPAMIDAAQAAREVMKALQTHPLEHAFPFSLTLALRLARAFPSLWYRHVAPKMSRATKIDGSKS